MAEQMRARRAVRADQRGHGDVFDAADGGPELVTVNHGPYTEQLPVGGLSVGMIRARFRDRFDIDPRSQALLDGQEVGADTIVRAGQVLMFSRKAGEKGTRHGNHDQGD